MSIQRITTSGRNPAPHSIITRRVWRADPPTPETPASGTPPAGAQNTGDTPDKPQTVPYERFAEVNSRMRESEAALNKLIEEKKKRDEADMLARGEHEKVIAELRPQAERATALEATLNEYLAAEMAVVPDNMKFLFADGDAAARLKKIREAKAAGLIGKPPAPNLDAGESGTQGSSVKPTVQQQAAADLAKQMGFDIDPQKLAVRTKELENRKRQPKKDDE